MKAAALFVKALEAEGVHSICSNWSTFGRHDAAVDQVHAPIGFGADDPDAGARGVPSRRRGASR